MSAAAPVSRPWREVPGGLVVSLRVTPRAGTDRIDGIEPRDDGLSVLRLRVRAVPDGGRANAAVIALLARALGVPRSDIALLSGATARLKSLRIAGAPEDLAARLAALLAPPAA